MAEHDIRLKIGSVFSGEGLTQMREGVKTANDNIRVASRGVSQLSGAIAGMDGAAAKAASAAGTMIQAFMSGNAVLIASQAGMMAVSYAMSYFKERADEAKAAAEELASVMHEKLTATIADRLTKSVDEMARLRGEFESTTKAANALATAAQALSIAESKGTIADMEFAKFKAVLETETEQMKKLVAAEHDLEIARVKEAQSAEEWKSKTDAARTASEQADERERLAKESLTKATAELANMQNALEAEGGTSKELMAAVNKLKAEEAKLSAQYNDAVTAAKVAKVQVQIADRDASTAATQMALATAKAEESVRVLTTANESEAAATEELTVEKKEESAEKRERRELQEELKEDEKKLKDITEQARQARADLAAAERDLANAEEEYRRNLQRNLTRDAMNDGTFNDPNAKRQRAESAGIENMLKQMNSNFTVRDDLRARREGQANQIAWENSATVKQRAREQYRWEQLKDKPDAQLTREQLEFREAYEARQQWENEQARQREEAAERMIEAQARLASLQDSEEQAYSDIGSIKQKLEALGLK